MPCRQCQWHFPAALPQGPIDQDLRAHPEIQPISALLGFHRKQLWKLIRQLSHTDYGEPAKGEGQTRIKGRHKPARCEKTAFGNFSTVFLLSDFCALRCIAITN